MLPIDLNQGWNFCHWFFRCEQYSYLSFPSSLQKFPILDYHTNSELIPNLKCAAKMLALDLNQGWHFCHWFFRCEQYSCLSFPSSLKKFPILAYPHTQKFWINSRYCQIVTHGSQSGLALLPFVFSVQAVLMPTFSLELTKAPHIILSSHTKILN
jgi:hypothetical protein